MPTATLTLARLHHALRASWGKDTTADPEGWSSAMPERGQCAVTALVVQDYFGGGLVRCVVEGASHYYNQFEGRGDVDLTRSQFAAFEPCDVSDGDRAHVLSYPATRDRYDILRERVACQLFTFTD